MSIDRPFRLRLLHFNDLHGRLAEVRPDRVEPVFSRIAGFIRRARAEVAGQPDAGVLVLAGGDDLVGSPFGELAGVRPEHFRRHSAYRLYSEAGVDACVVGNHDVDWGLGMLSVAAGQDARFPLLSANLVPASSAPRQGIQPWAVVAVNGLRIGIIGLTTQAEVKQVVPGEFELCDPLAATLDLLPVVRAQADVVVLLSHLGHCAVDAYPPARGIRDAELALALPSRAVPVIVGSHTHTILNATGLEPGAMVNGILLAQAGSNGQYLGDIEIEVRPAGAEVVNARLWAVDSLPDDPEFERAHVEPLARPVQQLLSEPVGPVGAHEDLNRAQVRECFSAGESALANFVADALAARCRAAGVPVDFFMLDSPCLSDGLPQAGTLTFHDLFRVAPYADSIVWLRLPGRALQAFLDDNARRADAPGESHEERGFVQFSREVRYRIARLPAAGHGAPAPRAAQAFDITIDGAGPSQFEGRQLIVGCSSFFREFSWPWEQRVTQQGLPTFDVRRLPCEYTRLALREELVAHVRQAGGITEATGLARDGRVVFVDSGSGAAGR